MPNPWRDLVVSPFSLLEKGIHGIALDQLRVKGPLNRLLGKDVEPHDPPVDHDKDPVLAGDIPKSFHIPFQVLLFVLIDIPHSAGLGVHLGYHGEDVIPDLSDQTATAYSLSWEGIVRSF